jgi:hypothetical protein
MDRCRDDVPVWNLANNGMLQASGRQPRTCKAAENAHAEDEKRVIRRVQGRARGRYDAKSPLPLALAERSILWSQGVAQAVFPKRRVTSTRRGCCFWPAAEKAAAM